MGKPIIQIQKSNINQIDIFFKKYFSIIESPFEIYIGNKIEFFPHYTYLYGTEAYKNPWVIFNKGEPLVIYGEITYQPGIKEDSLIFTYFPDIAKYVPQLIDEIINKIEITGFTNVDDNADMIGSQDINRKDSKPSSHPGLSLEEFYDNILYDSILMKGHYKDYNPDRAKSILDVIPTARKRWPRYSVQWGPGVISKFCSVGSTTVGRYLKAFHKVGLKAIEIDGEMIPIPHRQKYPSKTSNSPSKS